MNIAKSERKYLLSIVVSLAVVTVSAILVFSDWKYLSGHKGLGRAIQLILYVTIPFAVISLGSAILIAVELARRIRRQ